MWVWTWTTSLWFVCGHWCEKRDVARVRPVLQGQVRVLFEKVPSSQSLFLAPSEGYLHSLRLFSTTKLTIRNGSDKELLPLQDGIS